MWSGTSCICDVPDQHDKTTKEGKPMLTPSLKNNFNSLPLSSVLVIVEHHYGGYLGGKIAVWMVLLYSTSPFFVVVLKAAF